MLKLSFDYYHKNLNLFILIGTIGGVIYGIIFGEKCQNLGGIANAYIRLLQMPIFPYIFLALSHGIGSIRNSSKKLFFRAIFINLLAWIIGFIILFVFPFTLPSFHTGSFYSSSLLESGIKINYLEYIPANPFDSFANGIVPAILLCSFFVGLGIYKLKKKDHILSGLNEALKIVTNIIDIIVLFAPIGLFAIIANSIGMIEMNDVSKLIIYIISRNVFSFFLILSLIPLTIRIFLPIKYRELFSSLRAPLLLAFAVGNVLIAIPLMIENLKTLLKKYHGSKKDDIDNYTPIIISAVYLCPDFSKFFIAYFVMFIDWFYGQSMGFLKTVQLIIASIPNMVVDPTIAVPALLNTMRLPSDAFKLYLLTEFSVKNTGALLDALAIMAIVAIAFQITFKEGNKVKLRNVIKSCLIIISSFILVVFLLKFTLNLVLPHKVDLSREKIAKAMYVHGSKVKMIVHKKKSKINIPKQSTIERIKNKGYLRVAYMIEPPFVYFNSKNELVGFDIAMINFFALYFNCKLELFPVTPETLTATLNSGKCDVGIGKVIVTPQKLEVLQLGNIYMNLTVALVVEDYKVKDFKNLEELRKNKNLKVAIPKDSHLENMFTIMLPNAKKTYIDNVDDYFNGKTKTDALFVSAEKGSFYTLLFPFYNTIIPNPNLKLALAFPIKRGKNVLLDLLNYGIHSAKESGFWQKNYNYWILGQLNAYDDISVKASVN